MLLLGLLRGKGSSSTSSERLIGNSSIFHLGSFIVQLYVFIDSHCHTDRRLRSLTSRAPADQKKRTTPGQEEKRKNVAYCSMLAFEMNCRGGPSDNGYGILMLSRPRNGAGQKQT